MRSELPPGGKLTMKRIGFDGQLCAPAVNVHSRRIRKTGTVRVFHAASGVDCQATICQPFGPLIQTLV